jgi:hypothetical protein
VEEGYENSSCAHPLGKPLHPIVTTVIIVTLLISMRFSVTVLPCLPSKTVTPIVTAKSPQIKGLLFSVAVVTIVTVFYGPFLKKVIVLQNLSAPCWTTYGERTGLLESSPEIRLFAKDFWPGGRQSV